MIPADVKRFSTQPSENGWLGVQRAICGRVFYLFTVSLTFIQKWRKSDSHCVINNTFVDLKLEFSGRRVG